MTALTTTVEEALLVHARELRTMIEDPTCDSGTLPHLTRRYFRLLRRLHERGINFYGTQSAP